MGNKRKLSSHENQIKGVTNGSEENLAIFSEAKERKKENWTKKDQKMGNADVLGTKLGSGSKRIEIENKGSELTMLL